MMGPLQQLLLAAAAAAGPDEPDAVLLPLAEASGAAYGDLVAGGRFCAASSGSTARAAVVDATALSVTLLGGPTPHSLGSFTALGEGGAFRAAGSADTDGDGFTELVLARGSELVTIRFAADCSGVVGVHSHELGPGDDIIGLAPWAGAAGRLLAVRESGNDAFLSLTATGAGWASTPVGGTGLGHSLAEMNGTTWRAVAGTPWRDGTFAVVNDTHALSLEVMAGRARPGLRILAAARLAPPQQPQQPPLARPIGAAILDPEGDGQYLAAVAREDALTSLFTLPFLQPLGSQALDEPHPHWASVASVELGADYGNATDTADTTAPWVRHSRDRGAERQQLLGLRRFPELDGCPGDWRPHQADDATLCCAGADCAGARRAINASARCCLRRGVRSGWAGAPPCRADGKDGGSGTTIGQFSVSLLLYGGGSLWRPRAAAVDQALMQEGPPNWFDPGCATGQSGCAAPPLGVRSGQNWSAYIVDNLVATGTNLYSHTVCDRQGLVGRNDSWQCE